MTGSNAVCDALEDAWNELKPQWSAEAGRKYESTIFDALCAEADGVCRRNELMDQYIQSVAGISENQQEEST